MFEVGTSKPGDVVSDGSQDWTINLVSFRSVEKLEIIVNGEVVETLEGFEGGGTKSYSGTVALPQGGWVAARAVGGATAWPSMGFFPFAHSAPIWINEVGSTDSAAARAAAQDLLTALEYSEAKFVEAYADGVPPSVQERFNETRARLKALIEQT
jgi:TolB protein